MKSKISGLMRRAAMEIKIVNKSSVKEYIGFCRTVYKGNIYYRDTMSLVLDSILSNKAEICKSSATVPVMVLNEGRVAAVCIFAVVDRMSDVLQMTHFEALENQETAVDALFEYGRKLAVERGIKTITVGFNLHVNYVLGILANRYEEVQSFGNAYNPPYYIDYFKRYKPHEVNFTNYLTDIKNFDFGIRKKVKDRISSRYNVRKADFRNMKREAEIYTRVNNLAFREHKFYYERRINEDLELFKEFRFFLKEENLLFLEHDGETIGFMLWYPDFSQLIKPGESLGIRTFLRNKLFGKRINRFKLVELGVVPEYQKSGAVMALFSKLEELTANRYEFCETGWILQNNTSSLDLCSRWAEKEYKNYKIFLIQV
jgi:hypothetical protein